MSLPRVQDEQQLDQVLTNDEDILLAFVIDGNQGSARAKQALEEALTSHPSGSAYLVDAKTVRNAASRFGVSAVPTVLRLKRGQTLDRLVGPQSPATYAALLVPPVRTSPKAIDTAAKQPSVKVYVTNTCPWCRRLESYLDQHGIRYSKINVQNDPAAAQAMQRKSGQMGVPQAEIGGQMVVGFDKARIDRLLNLR